MNRLNVIYNLGPNFQLIVTYSFSTAMISPNVVLLDFEYDAMHAMKNAWKPAITWLEYVSPWKVRGCVTTVGGMPGALRGGKLKWLALYNHTQSSTEQSGVFRMASSVLTAGKMCMHVDFKQVGRNISPNKQKSQHV